MFVKQISVFLENYRGALREMIALLGSASINIRALSVADTQAFGVVRLIVHSDDIDMALKLLKGAGYTARTNNVICAEVDDKPNGLCNLLSIIEKEDISIEYMYSFFCTLEGRALMVLRLSDKQRGLEALKQYGVRLHGQEDIDRV